MRTRNFALPIAALLLLARLGTAQEAVPSDAPVPAAVATPAAAAQPAAPASPVVPAQAEKPLPKGEFQIPGHEGVLEDKHAFGVLPNYRTAENDLAYVPITTAQKFKIATSDSIDGPSFVLAAFFSGLSQIEGSEPSFGGGVTGFAHRYITGLADQDMGNYMTEAIMPTLLHQDPRYFRKGTGSIIGRVWWAARSSIVAKNDHGHWTFNAAEWLGNGVTASVGNAYYPDDRGFSPTMDRMLVQVGTDTVSQILKEFWPDIKKSFFHKHSDADVQVPGAVK